MKKLIKSKKGGIPAVNEIVMTFLNIIPKPVKAILFILLITLISSFVVPTVLELFGYTCVERTTGEVELYQIPMDNLMEKLYSDVAQGLVGTVGRGIFEVPNDPFPLGNISRFRIKPECFVESDVNGTRLYGYSALCMDCPTNRDNFFQGFFVPLDEMVCTGDAIEERGVRGLWNAKFCTQCQPPEEYYYNHTNCVNEQVCSFTLLPEYEEGFVLSEFYMETKYRNIIKMGGVKRQQDSSEFSNIQCTDNARPSVYVYSIEVFNLQMWVLLFAVGLLIGLAMTWYNVTL